MTVEEFVGLLPESVDRNDLEPSSLKKVNWTLIVTE